MSPPPSMSPPHVLYVYPPCPPFTKSLHVPPCPLPCPLIAPMSPPIGKEEDGIIRSVKITICARWDRLGTSGTPGTLEMGRGTGILGHQGKGGDIGVKQISAPPCPIGVLGSRDMKEEDTGDNRAVGDR